MASGAMLALVGVLLVYLMPGLWAVPQIFPRGPGITFGSDAGWWRSRDRARERNVTGPQEISPGSERS